MVMRPFTGRSPATYYYIYVMALRNKAASFAARRYCFFHAICFVPISKELLLSFHCAFIGDRTRQWAPAAMKA